MAVNEEEKIIFGSLKLHPEFHFNFPPMGPNFDLRTLSVYCTSHKSVKGKMKGFRDKMKKASSKAKRKPEQVGRTSSKVLLEQDENAVLVKVILVIGPNKFRIPLFEEGNIDLSGEFEVGFLFLSLSFSFLSLII